MSNKKPRVVIPIIKGFEGGKNVVQEKRSQRNAIKIKHKKPYHHKIPQTQRT